MNIAVIGTGYVGLVSGACFASLGNTVVCVDIDAKKVARMQAGEVPLYEPGLEKMFSAAVSAGKLSFTTQLKDAVPSAQAIFLALPTPPGEDGSADLSYVLDVANKLGPLLSEGAVVVDKSTVPVGTNDKVRAAIATKAKVSFDVVSNPEFLREGVALDDFMKPDRVVIGTMSNRARKLLGELYGPITDKDHPILFMDERSAELTKYAANSFLATKITFMNEIANLCELVGADVDSVRIGVGSDPRIGDRFLYAGIGYGGSCFPKDVMALKHAAGENNYDFGLLEAVITANQAQKQRLSQKVEAYFKGDVKGQTLALWGIAFKPETDDIREAPAVEIIRELLGKGARLRVYDPEAMDNARSLFKDEPAIYFATGAADALKDADALLIATEWDEFCKFSLADIKSALKQPVIFDGRNIFELDKAAQAGFHYESIGRASVIPKTGADTQTS